MRWSVHARAVEHFARFASPALCVAHHGVVPNNADGVPRPWRTTGLPVPVDGELMPSYPQRETSTRIACYTAPSYVRGWPSAFRIIAHPGLAWRQAIYAAAGNPRPTSRSLWAGQGGGHGGILSNRITMGLRCGRVGMAWCRDALAAGAAGASRATCPGAGSVRRGHFSQRGPGRVRLLAGEPTRGLLAQGD